MSSSTAQIIKEKLPIYDVVSSYVKLEKAGSNWKAKSPFTNEKTPSFFVVPDKDFFYCFSSGKGGDIFTFIQEIEGVDFKGALKMLADKAGVSLETTYSKKEDDSEIFLALEYATRLYALYLRRKEGEKAKKYLLDREITEESISNFRIGFAPDSWDSVHKNLTKHKINTDSLLSAGLVKKGEKGKYYDRFRNRVMFPIKNSQGKVVGFSGRILPEDKTEQGKYINSPEGPLYNKSRVLYGYDQAKKQISKKNECIIVEGQIDVVMSHQAGSENTIGISGTGLTFEHLDLIKRFTANILFALDSDGPGMRALKRSVERAYQKGFTVKVVALPKGEDPASIIQKEPKLWMERLNKATDYIDFLLDPDLNGADLSEENRKQYITDDVFSMVNWIESHIEQDKAIQKIANFLNVSVDSVRIDFDAWKSTKRDTPIRDYSSSEEKTPNTHTVTVENELIGLLLWLSAKDEKEDDITSFCDSIKSKFNIISDVKIEEKIEKMSDIERDILSFIINQKYEGSSTRKIKSSLEELLLRLEINSLQIKAENILNKIRSQEDSEDSKLQDELLADYKELSDKIIELKNKLHSYGS